ncbi:hypothetical protein A2U01_0011354 [Trifolium medium]|uniref:Uncharacterized protein n=1 Tax=Trifolium medium TaxID=97028 RepID=A0A392MUS7_9FABA|nr:hypothetical protein [Trifolium medium]
MKPFETGMRNCLPESLRVDPVGATSQTKCFKQPPRRFIKIKRFKWKLKKEKPKSDPKASGTCASRRRLRRVAPSFEQWQEFYLVPARRAAWYGAARR